MTEVGGLGEPPELRVLRASVGEAHGRVERATRRLELATELEARLEALLQAPSLSETLVGRSPERDAAEVEATGILLQAELRAAEILNSSAVPAPAVRGPDPGPTGSAAVTLSPDAVRALQRHLEVVTELEESLVELARRALELNEVEVRGPAPGPVDASPAKVRRRSAGRARRLPSTRLPPQGDSPA
jgi:hypothetical protein